MSKLLGALLLSLSLPAHAALVCDGGGYSLTWQVGQPLNTTGMSPEYCYATGEELLYIERHFSGLRQRVGPKVGQDFPDNGVIWYGDDAQFIVSNL